MEIILLLFILFGVSWLAPKIGLGTGRESLGARVRLKEPDYRSRLEPQEPRYVALPTRPNVDQDAASSQEMLFAGSFLNGLGILLLTGGFLSYLRVSGLGEAMTCGGWLQSGLGLIVGAALSGLGHLAFEQGRRRYGEPLSAAGLMILFATLGASHFYFQQISTIAFLAGVFALVILCGLTAIRHNSTLTAAALVAAIFLGPTGMTFTLKAPQQVLGYLLAVNLACTLVAYFKRWDLLLIGSFVGSYVLYFSKFGVNQSVVTLVFLASTYLLYLLWGNVFHFWRRSAYDFDLWLSWINPMAFALCSYPTLLQLSNTWALGCYFVISALHLTIFWLAVHRSRRNPAFEEVAQSNLTLGLLFQTAAISFLIYCYRDDEFFGLVTFLWMLLGFLLLLGLPYCRTYLASVVRRASYLNISLAAAQLVYVVPTTASAYWVAIPGVLALLAYFALHEKRHQSGEGRLFANLVLLSALAAVQQTLMADWHSRITLAAAAGLAPALYWGWKRYPNTLVAARWAAPGLAAVIGGISLLIPWPLEPASLGLLWIALCLGCLAKMKPPAQDVVLALCLAVLYRGCWVVRHQDLALALGCATFVWVLGFVCSRRVDALTPIQLLYSGLLTGVALVFPVTTLAGKLVLVLLVGALAGGYRWSEQSVLAVFASVVLLRGICACTLASACTLSWAMVGLVLLRVLPKTPIAGQLILLVAFVKAIVYDSYFGLPRSILHWGGIEAWEITEMCCMLAVVGAILVGARLLRENREWRIFLTLQAMIALAFQATAVLNLFFGALENFQVLLSGFWLLTATLLVAAGIEFMDKTVRLFGLCVVVASVAKMYAVDIWVLNSYDQSTTTCVIGAALTIISFLYQFNRRRLAGRPCYISDCLPAPATVPVMPPVPVPAFIGGEPS